MSLPDKHDPRRFRHFAQLNAEGAVIATVEVADGLPVPAGFAEQTVAEITDCYPYDFGGVVVAPVAVAEVLDVVAVLADAVIDIPDAVIEVKNPQAPKPPAIVVAPPPRRVLPAHLPAVLAQANKVPHGG